MGKTRIVREQEERARQAAAAAKKAAQIRQKAERDLRRAARRRVWVQEAGTGE
ncbi:hypothetical protein ABZ569_34085 [Streptomyces albus]|uniref:hypothetical protein n=1 Tax=Streptomyces albus TaxID=1888 RepID=UPI00340599D4